MNCIGNRNENGNGIVLETNANGNAITLKTQTKMEIDLYWEHKRKLKWNCIGNRNENGNEIAF